MQCLDLGEDSEKKCRARGGERDMYLGQSLIYCIDSIKVNGMTECPGVLLKSDNKRLKLGLSWKKVTRTHIHTVIYAHCCELNCAEQRIIRVSLKNTHTSNFNTRECCVFPFTHWEKRTLWKNSKADFEKQHAMTISRKWCFGYTKHFLVPELTINAINEW